MINEGRVLIYWFLLPLRNPPHGASRAAGLLLVNYGLRFLSVGVCVAVLEVPVAVGAVPCALKLFALKPEVVVVCKRNESVVFKSYFLSLVESLKVSLLVGGLGAGFTLAVFLANSGGAWDNAKKYVEDGHFGGKNSDCHKATIVGDTVGDPFKDTSGPSLNILIKLMSMVSIVMAGLTVMVG